MRYSTGIIINRFCIIATAGKQTINSNEWQASFFYYHNCIVINFGNFTRAAILHLQTWAGISWDAFLHRSRSQENLRYSLSKFHLAWKDWYAPWHYT